MTPGLKPLTFENNHTVFPLQLHLSLLGSVRRPTCIDESECTKCQDAQNVHKREWTLAMTSKNCTKRRRMTTKPGVDGQNWAR